MRDYENQVTRQIITIKNIDEFGGVFLDVLDKLGIVCNRIKNEKLPRPSFWTGGNSGYPLDYWFTVVFCVEDMRRSTSLARGNLGTSKNYVLSVRLG